MKDKNKIMKQWNHQTGECYQKKRPARNTANKLELEKTEQKIKLIQNNGFSKELRLFMLTSRKIQNYGSKKQSKEE